MTIENIAKVAYEVNAALRGTLGQSHTDWNDEKESMIAGVASVLNLGSEMTPRRSHELWLEFKSTNGWVYGEVQDNQRKVHPDMVPYDDLPEWEKVKDSLFIQVVKSLQKYLDEE